MAATIVVDLKKIKWDFEFQTFLVDIQHEKIKKSKKEHDLTMTELET
jgi:hypothetical protein